ncbi:MAG: aliphatic sulfonate ABC transporter ATP-binding protein, partial [Burkholderiales bacterium]
MNAPSAHSGVQASVEDRFSKDFESRPVRLEIEALSKAYAGRRAIDEVSFSVREGEFLAVLGPSGAGKT